MPRFTVHYSFSQKFPFPAGEVYAWSTDYRPEDIDLSGREGKREIERIDDSTLILTDTVKQAGVSRTKVRLIRLFPDILTWTNTRLSEEGRHSQFIYKIVPDGPGSSRLDFSGAQLDESPKAPSSSQLSALARRYSEADERIWVNLAAALEKDLGPRRSRGTSGSRER